MPETETMTTRPQADPEHAHRVVRRLLSVDHRLPDEIRDDILALGDGALPDLLQILEEDDLSLSTAPGQRRAPAHAARLLGEMGAPQAVAQCADLKAKAGTKSYIEQIMDERGCGEDEARAIWQKNRAEYMEMAREAAALARPPARA